MSVSHRFWKAAAALWLATSTDLHRLPPTSTNSQSREILLATTTSTRDAGLLDSLLPVFERETGFQVKVVAVGSGQALALGRRGDADVVLSHAPEAERPPSRTGGTRSYIGCNLTFPTYA